MPQLSLEEINAILPESPFIAFTGLVATEVDPDEQKVVLRMPARAELMRSSEGDMFHGGPIAALIDTAGDFAVAALLGGPVPTSNMRVDYIRPAIGGALDARAQVRRLGRQLATVDIDVLDEQGRLCAIGRAVYPAQVG